MTREFRIQCFYDHEDPRNLSRSYQLWRLGRPTGLWATTREHYVYATGSGATIRHMVDDAVTAAILACKGMGFTKFVPCLTFGEMHEQERVHLDRSEEM